MGSQRDVYMRQPAVCHSRKAMHSKKSGAPTVDQTDAYTQSNKGKRSTIHQVCPYNLFYSFYHQSFVFFLHVGEPARDYHFHTASWLCIICSHCLHTTTESRMYLEAPTAWCSHSISDLTAPYWEGEWSVCAERCKSEWKWQLARSASCCVYCRIEFILYHCGQKSDLQLELLQVPASLVFSVEGSIPVHVVMMIESPVITQYCYNLPTAKTNIKLFLWLH